MSELFGVHGIVVAIVALIFIGPKDLPKALRALGYWTGKARGVANQFRQGFDNMVREAELAEMEKKWRAENERIMREHPAEPAAETVDQPAMIAETTEQPHAVVDPTPLPMAVEHPVVEPAAPGTPPRAPDSTPS